MLKPLQQSPVPSCYGSSHNGKPLWSETDAECAGGLDPNYVHPVRGSHIRDTCDYFHACGKLSGKLPPTALVPPSSLVRPQAPPQPQQQPQAAQQPRPSLGVNWVSSTPAPAQTVVPQTSLPTVPGLTSLQVQMAFNALAPLLQQVQQATQLAQQVQRPQYPQYQHQQMQQQMQAPPPMQMGYQQMMPVNHYMPSYLSVPEPVQEGDSIMGRLLREVGRSMGKSVGHTIANFFDNNVFGRR